MDSAKDIEQPTAGPVQAIVLLPCPFCGGDAMLDHIPAHTHDVSIFVIDSPDTFTIECLGCAAGLCGNKRSDVEAKWNRRQRQKDMGDIIKDYWESDG